MHAVEATGTRIEQAKPGTDWDHAFADVLVDLDRRGGAGARQATDSVRCVSGGYLTDECSCRASIPREIVDTAWRRRQGRGFQEGFFRFAWHDEVWVGYGLQDGSVRGVYCPTHSAERDRRAHEARTGAPSLHRSA
jgi:hypothetical protein